ncbi:MAG: DegV family protein [Oscillospiraceae bacterium]|jgi:DegV family protein with EDD domain|nr:DegV family protein [Oscillospiraceae bacterium]
MVKIIADSTCDLSPKILKKHNITLTPLSIISGEDEFRDGVDIRPADVFRMADEEKRVCKTAAVNVFDYQKTFEEYSKKYGEVVQICIGLGFSACFQNAKIAAEDFPNVRVADSRNLSAGSGYLVYEAALMAEANRDGEEICRYIEENRSLINTSFVINRLDYLHRGGRCSLASLIGSRLLGIKPCIEVADGFMRVGKKYRGNFEECLDEYVKDRLSDTDNINLKRVFITHPMCSRETVERVRQAVEKRAAFGEIIETRAGCAISNHCGPNTLGVIFKQKTAYKR